MSRSWDQRRLVAAKNLLRRAALQVEFALNHMERGDVEVGLRAAFAYAIANEGLTELGRAERRINRRATRGPEEESG